MARRGSIRRALGVLGCGPSMVRKTMCKKKVLAYRVITVVMTLLLTFNASPFTALASQSALGEGQEATYVDDGSSQNLVVPDDEGSEGNDAAGDDISDEPSDGQDELQFGDQTADGTDDGSDAQNQDSEQSVGDSRSEVMPISDDEGSLGNAADSREAEVFDANGYVSKLALSLTSGDVSKDYEASGSETIDTTKDFPDGLSRSATYVATLSIDTEGMLKAQDKYPFVAGDSITCSVPDLIRTGGSTTSGRLVDTTAEWNDTHNGVGDYTVTQDENGHNVLTITYDDGYVIEKSGKIIASSVRLSGGFDTSSQTTESFETELTFGKFNVKTKFSKLEIIRNLSIEKTGETDSYGPYVTGTPGYPRQGGAAVDSNGYLTYTVKVTAGSDNTYKLTNVKVTDLFDVASQSKVDLSTMTLVSVVNDGKTTTDSAVALYDADGNINGWNIGDLGVGCDATVKFKVKINKDGITSAVDAAKTSDASSDAVDARTIKNTASVFADDTDAVSHDYSTVVKNYLKASKSTTSFDVATQKQHFTITVTSPEDNRYTMHDVPLLDYLSSGYLDAGYYKGSGIASMTVRHSDGTTESLAYENYQQINSQGKADSRYWYATIYEVRPGDVVTIDAYLELDESYWSHASGTGYVGNNSDTRNTVYVGNVGENGYYANDLNKTYGYSYFRLARAVLIKSGSLDSNNGTVSWTITGNQRDTTKEPTDVGGLIVTDILGPNQKFSGNVATVKFYNQDGTVKATETFVLEDGSTSFEYIIPAEYGTCEYRIWYTSTITDWDSYVGPEKSYSNTVNGYTAETGKRPRVAAMSKQFVQQADDWSRWKTEIFSELKNGDVYQDTSRNGVNQMYFTVDDLADISLTVDGTPIDESLYEIQPVSAGSSGGKYSSYTITFKGDVSASKDHPLAVSYKAHMVNPRSGSLVYYNDAKLTAGNVTDEDYDYCKRSNQTEIDKSLFSSGNGKMTWYFKTNYWGYSGQPDGTCVVTDTLPAGLAYESYEVVKAEKYGKVDSITPVANEDGTTTLTIKISGLQHDEVCKAHPTDGNGGYEFHFKINTKVTDPEYLYGVTSQTFMYTNTASLNDRYGNLKTGSATASIKHTAMKKTMVYSQATAPYAQFTIEANADKADLNPDGDTVRIVDESSKSLSIDTKSILVVDAKTGDPVDFKVDASQMANNIFVVEVPDEANVKITYQAQVVGAVGESVQVSNNAYYEGHRTTSGEGTIDQSVVVLKTSGEAESVPMVWFSKKNESAQALAGATYRLDVYNEDSQTWEIVRDDIESTGDNTRKGVKVEDLDLNKLYRMVETEAPDYVFGAPEGYVLDATPHYFVLYKDAAPAVSYPDDVDPDDVFKGPSGSVITAYDAPYTRVRFAKMSDDDVQLAGAEFTVYSVDADGNVSDTPARDKSGNEIKFTSFANQKNEFVIAPGTYQVVETKAPAGYTAAGTVTFVVKGDSEHTVTVNGEVVQTGVGEPGATPIEGYLNMVNSSVKTSLVVTKTWDDCSGFDGIRPEAATVQLVADGELVEGETLTLSDENGWSASFDNLDVMKAGKKVEYSVKEIDPATGEPVDSGSTMENGYKVTVFATTGDVVSGDAGNYTVAVMNSYTPASTSVSVSKTWDDGGNQDGIRPANVTVQLFADGSAVDGKTVSLDAANEWKASFDGLPAAHADGSAIVYAVKEIDPTTGEAVDFGATMGNGYKVELISAAYAGYPDGVNPTGIDNATSDAAGSRSISYAISNSRTPDTTTVEVAKRWVGPAAKSATVRVQSSADDGGAWADVAGASVTLSEGNGWAATFAGLPVFAPGQQGVKLTYRVVEDALDGYEAAYVVDGKASDGTVAPVAGQTERVTVVNTNAEKVEVKGTKVWEDGGDQDGTRPKSVTVRLLADGVEAASKVVGDAGASADNPNAWPFSFGDLAKYDPDDGHEIAYAMTEDPAEGYESAIGGSVKEGFTVTNSRTPDTTTVEVAKRWVGPAAKSATVRVQSSADDGGAWADVAGASVTLSEGNGWAATFAGLPVFAPGQQGVKLTYRVVEDALDGYEAAYVVDGKASDGTVAPVAGQTERVTVVNTNAEKVEVKGTKVWEDGGDQDGTRPKSVTVRLLADGVEAASKVVGDAGASADNPNAWPFSFGDLAKYDPDDGHEIAYAMTEDPAEGYESEVTGTVADGFTVTNTKEVAPTPDGNSTDSASPKKSMPQTGDHNGPLATTCLAAAALLLVAGALDKIRHNMTE